MSEGLLKGLVPKTRELGRLRTGDSVPVVKNGQVQTHADGSPKMRPNKRTTWRITSPALHLLEKAAELYGGEPQPWEDAPTPGQWELSTDKESIEVMIPYNDTALSQAYELWRAGGCERRCDGERMSDDTPCACPADIEARMKGAAARTPTACKPTTRLNVLLPDIPELGYWRLECHGYNAAVEIPGQLALAQGLKVAYKDPNPYFIAWLRIEPRVKKKDNETLRFQVPVIEIPASGRSLMIGPAQAPAAALSPGTTQDEGGDLAPALTTGSSAGGSATSPAPPSDVPASERPFTEADATLAPVAWQRQFTKRAEANGVAGDDLVALVEAATQMRAHGVRQVAKTDVHLVEAALAAELRVA